MGTLTDVPGVLVGHDTDLVGLTGCTVVLCPDGAVAAVDVRGAAPGTRETDLLRPGMLVERIDAVLLTGGSAFGLAAATGVVQYLEERGLGFDTGVARVPIVPAAVIFDLGIGDPRARPDAAAGYRACLAATADPVPLGCVGAGTGATVGKAGSRLVAGARPTKAGLGSAMARAGDVLVAALVVVNAFGDVVDPATGQVVAGARLPAGGFVETVAALMAGGQAEAPPLTNTTIGVVATNVPLDRAALGRVATMAHDGLARTIRPVHTQYDGDTLFALRPTTAAGPPADPTLVGTLAAEAVAAAVLSAVRTATPLGGLDAANR